MTHTPGPWFVSGVRHRMNGGEWHSINRYDEAKKRDENIACVGYDSRTGIGHADARLIAAAPDLLRIALIAEQFMSIATDWNFDEAEIDGEMQRTHDLLRDVRAAIAKAQP